MNKMLLAWGQRVSDAFAHKTFSVVNSLGWPQDLANDLMACMAFETGETFSPTIRNAAGSGAVGLIQFMPATAKALGTSTEDLLRMNAVQQLAYVEKYFRIYASKIKTVDDMYMAILMPRYITAEPDDRIFINPSIAYRQNAGLDNNKDGFITKGEITLKVRTKLSKGLTLRFARRIPDIPIA